MTTICPNCKREDTMNAPAVGSAFREGYGVCGACGWIGNEKAFGYVKPKPDPYAHARKKGERLHTMYIDDDGKTVVGDDW